MRIIRKIIITLLLFMVTQAHAEYNAGVVTAAFANTPCRINTDLQPYAMVRNLGDIGSYKVVLEVYKSIALWPDSLVSSETIGPVEIAAGGSYYAKGSFSTATEGKYYVKATVLSLAGDAMEGNDANANPFTAPAVPVSNETYGKIVSLAPQDSDWSSLVGGVETVIHVQVTNTGEEGDIAIVPTDLPSNWVLDTYTLSRHFTANETYTFSFKLTPPQVGGSASILWNVVYDQVSVVNSQVVEAQASGPNTTNGTLSLKVNTPEATTLTVEGSNLFKRTVPPAIDFAAMDQITAITAQADGEYLDRELAADLFYRTTFMESRPLYEHIYRGRVQDYPVTENNGGLSFNLTTFNPLRANNTTSVQTEVMSLMNPAWGIIFDIKGKLEQFDQRKTTYKNILVTAATLNDLYKNYPQYFYDPTEQFREMMLENKARLEAVLPSGQTITGDPLTDLQTLANNVTALSGITGADRFACFASNMTSIFLPYVGNGLGEVISTLWDDSDANITLKRDYEEFLFRILLLGSDVATRIEQLRIVRNDSSDRAFQEAFDETLGDFRTDMPLMYETVYQKMLKGVSQSLSLASSVYNSLFPAGYDPSSSSPDMISATIFASQEIVQLYRYLDKVDVALLDSQLSYELRRQLEARIKLLEGAMTGEPQSIGQYDNLNALRTIYYFLGYREALLYKAITGTYDDDMSIFVWLGTWAGSVCVDTSFINTIEGNYLSLLASSVKSSQYMSTILARSYGDLDKDGYHDLEDKFPADTIYWQDDDDDGLPDRWERSIAGNLTALDGTGDQDSDTIIDAEEFTLGTSPTEKSIRLKVGSARVAVFSDEGTVKSRITWVPVQVTGMTYRVYRLSLGSLQLIGTNISEYAFVDEHRGDPADVYFVVAVSDAGEEGPRVQTLRYEISASGFTPEKLAQVNTPSPGGNTLLYGVIEHPLTGCLVEQGELIIYGTTGTYYATIVQGRVRLKVTAPAMDTGDSPWTVVLQTDGGTYQLDPLSLDVAEGYTVTNLKTSSAAGSATVTFTRASGYGYTKVEVSEVGGSTQVLYEGVGATCQATEFEQGALLTFKVTPYRLVGDQVPEYGDPLLIRERVGWGGQLLRDTVISWNNDAEDQKYPHFVFSTITVPVGLSLTIEPETWLQFASNSVNLNVYGSLIADGGDATHRIFMSSTRSKKAPNSWGYVRFLDGSTGMLNQVYFGYGDTDAQVLVDGGEVTISNCLLNTVSVIGIQIQNSPSCTVIGCTIENMSGWGVKNLSTSGVINLLSNTVSNCTSGGIYAGNATFDGNTLNGNGTHDSIYVSGTLTGNIVWSQNIRFYQVTIPVGSKLSIVPGVQCFGHNSAAYISVAGQMVAEGTSAQPITFTSAQETKAGGQWRGIFTSDGSVVTLRHAVIEYAGGNVGSNNGAVEVAGGTIVIDHVSVHDIANTYKAASGILITNSPSITITDSTFKDIENWGIVDSATSDARITGNTLSGCVSGSIKTTNPATVITGNTLIENGSSNAVYFTGTITGEVIWSQNVRFYLVTVAAGAKLTILPGVQCFGVDYSSYISVLGQLVAEGTSAQPITFTSAQETKAGGQWRGILTRDGSVVTLRHAVIEYAGGNVGSNNGAVEVGGGTVVIDHVSVHDIANTYKAASGILITNSPSITITDSTFKDIENWGIIDSATSDARITGNTLSGCVSGSIKTTNPATVITGNTLIENGSSNAVYFTGTITGEVTWSQNVRFYLVTVAAGAKLTILPGVQCFGVDYSSYISVLGQLVAEGTSAQPITFTSAQETKAGGQWRGILTRDGSVVTLRHAVIEYAGGNVGSNNGAVEVGGGTVVIDHVSVHDIANTYKAASGILITNSPSITITDSTFKDIENWGIVDSATSDAHINGNTITNCLTGAISTTNSATIISGNTLTENGNNDAVYFTGTVSGDVTWAQNTRFYQVTVEAGASLTIQPGITCYGHNATSFIVVGGKLTAEGTAAQPIQFTSAQETRAAGQWRGIITTAGSDVSLRYVSIEYAGGSASSNTAALEVRGGSIFLDQISVNRIANVNTSYGADGIWIKDGATAEIIGPTIEEVEGWAIRNNATGQLTMDLAYSVIRNNGYGVYSNGQDIDARLVNWGYITGPYHASLNTGGEGNEVRGNVLFTPWLLLNGTYYDFETGGWGKNAWATSGYGTWKVSSDRPLRGGYSAKAPLLGDNQAAAVSVITNCGEGYVSFTYGVDSAPGDRLMFYIDGKLIQAYSGTVSSAMTPVDNSFFVSAGSHTFTWVWRKDGANAAGEDTAWIDDVILPLAEGHVEGRVVTDATDASTPLVNATVTLSDGDNEYVVTTDANGEYKVYNIPYGNYTMQVNKEGYQVSSQVVTVDGMGIRVIGETNISLVDTSTLYTREEVDEELTEERAKWDVNGDGKVSLEEAIHALQVVSGQ